MVEEALFLNEEEIIDLKKSIAQLLYEQGMEQSKISQILGLSQPMVSNYCSAQKTKRQNIFTYAQTCVNHINNQQPISFHHCLTFSNTIVHGNQFIARKNELIDHEKRPIVDVLTQAFLLLKNQDISGFIPKIKINIAQAKPNAHVSEDIAAFVNGFIIADDAIIGHNGIRFGCSSHLSSLLLNLQKKMEVNAIMNIAYLDQDRLNAYEFAHLKQDFSLDQQNHPIDILLHKGDFGIEPCTYVLGSDAVNVAKKVLHIINEGRP